MGLFMWIESTSVPPKWARGGSWTEGVSCFVFLFFYRKPIKKMRSSWSFLSSWVTSRLQPGQTSLHIIHILNTTVVHIHHNISPSTCLVGIHLLYSFFPSFYYISTESEWTPPPAGFFSVLHLILKLHQTQNEWNQSRNEATWICVFLPLVGSHWKHWMLSCICWHLAHTQWRRASRETQSCCSNWTAFCR